MYSTRRSLVCLLATAVITLWSGAVSAWFVDATYLIPSNQMDLASCATVTYSSQGGNVGINDWYPGVVDGLVDDDYGATNYTRVYYWGNFDPDQRLVLKDLNASGGDVTIRIFNQGIHDVGTRDLGDLHLYSSTSIFPWAADGDLDATNYETDLGTYLEADRTFTYGITGNPNGYDAYFDIPVSLPAGTQSLINRRGADKVLRRVCPLFVG